MNSNKDHEMTMVSTNQSGCSRIVVITSGGDFAQRILAGLALVPVRPRALILVGPSERKPAKRPRRRIPSPRRLTAAALRRALRFVEPAPRTKTPDPWSGSAEEVRSAGPLNGPTMLDVLNDLKPDYLVLAGAGILVQDALAIPRCGTFNVHPGLLPWIRGMSVVERAIERGIPIGITAHYVDPGIDTGAIIHRELIPVQCYDTLGSLRRKAYERCAQVMVDLVADAARGRHAEATPQRGRFRYCTALPDEDSAGLDASVRAGLALKLYRQWREFFGSDVLPPGNRRPPAEDKETDGEPIIVGPVVEPVRTDE